MTLQDRLMEDLKESMRSGDVIRKNAIRMVRAAIKNAEIEMHRPATDEEVESIISKEIKKRAEAIELFARGNRNDLVEEEKAGIVFLEEYLPTQMNDQELEKIIVETLAEIQATSIKDMGRAMKAIIAKVGNRADGRLVSELVRSKLA